MTSRMLACAGLLATWTACAADAPFMALRLGPDYTSTADALARTTDALARYPSCFDSLTLAAKLQPEQADALKKLGLTVDAEATGFAAQGLAPNDHAPRALISSALLFAAEGAKSPLLLTNGRGCASGKTARGLCVEAMLDLAYGATRLAFDMTDAHEPIAWSADTYLSELTLWRPFFQDYVRYNADTKPGGLLPYCGKNGKPSLNGTLLAADALAPSGFPVCPGSPWPVCYLLTADAVKTMTPPDIQRALSGGAILDGGTVALLQSLGHGAAMQMTASPRDPDIAELFTDDELNVNRVGYLWRPAATKDDTFALFPSNDTVRVVGRYQDAQGKAQEAASVLIETAQGARLAAFGFDGFGGEMSEARRRQLLLAADWVSQNRLPVFVETPMQAVAVPRVTQAGDLRSVTLLNASIDVQPPVTLRLRGCPEGLARMSWLTPKEKPVTIAVRWEDRDALVTLPAVGPWQIGWLRATE